MTEQSTHSPEGSAAKSGASLGDRIQSHASRAAGSPWFWIALVLLIASWPIVRATRLEMPKAPPTYFQIPPFELTDHTGKPFGTTNLQGRIWIANFVFTSCRTICPELTQTMSKLQRRVKAMGDTVMLVSFSVDPERDTPEVLAEYAKKYKANPRRWRFLTGAYADIEKLVVQGFKMPMDPGTSSATPSLIEITHGSRFMLIDTHGRVRGFYEPTEEQLDKMMEDLSVVANLGDHAPPTQSPPGGG